MNLERLKRLIILNGESTFFIGWCLSQLGSMAPFISVILIGAAFIYRT